MGDMRFEVREGEVLSGPGAALLNNPHVKKACLGAWGGTAPEPNGGV